NYYDQNAVHFESFEVRVIANSQSSLNALQAGQVAYAEGSNATAEAAKQAGLNVSSVPYGWYGAFFLDRGGEMVPALADERVRQALNYAVDRQGITNAVLGEYGEPNNQTSIPGYEESGYVPEYADRYPYDPEK